MFHCDPYADRTHICNLNLHQNKGSGFARVNLVEVIHPQSFTAVRSKADILRLIIFVVSLALRSFAIWLLPHLLALFTFEC